MIADESIQRRWAEIEKLDAEVQFQASLDVPPDMRMARHLMLKYLRHHGWEIPSCERTVMVALWLLRQALRAERELLIEAMVDGMVIEHQMDGAHG